MFLNTHPSILAAHARDRMASSTRRAEQAERAREARRAAARTSSAQDGSPPRPPEPRPGTGGPTAPRLLERLRFRLRLHLGSAR